jgi:hypothetical protein
MEQKNRGFAEKIPTGNPRAAMDADADPDALQLHQLRTKEEINACPFTAGFDLRPRRRFWRERTGG